MEKKIIARNKKAQHEYFILDTLECGIVLTGTEIKSIRMGKVSIQEAYCQVKDNNMYIYNMDISKYTLGTLYNHNGMLIKDQIANRIHKLAHINY